MQNSYNNPNPYLKFYVKDLLAAKGLGLNSAAIGIWVQLRCIMTSSLVTQHGYLISQTDQPPAAAPAGDDPPAGIVVEPLPDDGAMALLPDVLDGKSADGNLLPCMPELLGVPRKLFEGAVKQLVVRRLFAWTPEGILYDPVAVAEFQKHESHSERGKLGARKRWGKPAAVESIPQQRTLAAAVGQTMQEPLVQPLAEPMVQPMAEPASDAIAVAKAPAMAVASSTSSVRPPLSKTTTNPQPLPQAEGALDPNGEPPGEPRKTAAPEPPRRHLRIADQAAELRRQGFNPGRK